MNEPSLDPSPRPAPDLPSPPPETGVLAVDHAIAPLAELGAMPLGEHHERLASAHAALHDALESDQS